MDGWMDELKSKRTSVKEAKAMCDCITSNFQNDTNSIESVMPGLVMIAIETAYYFNITLNYP
ncbi:uncharacterized protein G2W53_021166 [Senna tora]|uniref:Uncharacterized protein n=1 Tax=Senna tora TaxID=362788 RepID=A0A834TKK7_9FABA|nr:uncharacterized protein G2W53_021166 [Senna tora]